MTAFIEDILINCDDIDTLDSLIPNDDICIQTSLGQFLRFQQFEYGLEFDDNNFIKDEFNYE